MLNIMLMDFDTCPLDAMDNSSYVVAGTIIDHRSFDDRNGETHKNQKRLFVAKGKARENIVRQLEKKGKLQYCVYDVSRGSSPTECSTGESFEFVKQLTRDQLKGFIPKGETVKWLEPFDYEKIFAPKSPEELRKIVGAAPPIGSSEESGKKKKDEEEEVSSGKDVDNIDDLL